MGNHRLSSAQGQDEDALVAKAEEMCLSPLRALPNPKLLQGWTPSGGSSSTKVASSFKPESPSTNSSSPHKKKSSMMQSADFKIKKKVGATETRQMALNNSRLSAYSSELADSDIEPDRHESIARLIEGSKMRRLQDAKKLWTRNHGSSSPFRMNMSSEFSVDRGSSGNLDSANVVRISNLKGIEATGPESPTVKSSTFSKFKDSTSLVKGTRPPAAVSSFKRGGALPKLQTNATQANNNCQSPQFKANKRNFETTEMVVEPGSPAIILNTSNTSVGQEMIVDNFGSGKIQPGSDIRLEGKCFLKTRTDRFKEHYAVVVGKDLLCFRKQGDTD